jgi:RNA polymerase sigma-70 factor (ECF subfamily)
MSENDVDSVWGDPTQFENVLRKARDGDPEAIGEILARYRNYLLHIAHEELDADLKPKVGASDLVQESILEGHRDFRQFTGSSAVELMAWLRGILKNNLRDLRKAFRSAKRDLDSETDPNSATQALEIAALHAQQPIDSAERREVEEAVLAAIAELGDNQRQVVLLRHQEDLTFAEIGARVGVSEEAARKLWYRAVEKLKDSLKDHGDLP